MYTLNYIIRSLVPYLLERKQEFWVQEVCRDIHIFYLKSIPLSAEYVPEKHRFDIKNKQCTCIQKLSRANILFLCSAILHIKVTNKLLLYVVLLASLNMNFPFSSKNLIYYYIYRYSTWVQYYLDLVSHQRQVSAILITM